MKTINLTQGRVALVDDEDFDRVNQFKWYASNHKHTWYAQRNRMINGKKSTQRLHSFILPGVKQIDHENRNGLDCQKHNLRPATFAQNHANSIKRKGKCSSKFKGVCWDKRGQQWLAYITVDKKFVHIGYFLQETDAALAYDKKAVDVFGKFARLNFGK